MYVYVGDVALAVERALERPRAIGQKYLLGAEALDGQVYTQLISQVSGVALPWFRFPDWLVTTASHLLTWRANLWTHTPPPWGLSIDAAWTLWHGFVFDGSKAVRELGIRYTPIRRALEEAVASYQAG
jgi:dihydroflavonol-4-reductase